MPIRQLAFVPCESRTNRARPTPRRDGCSDSAAKIRATTSRPLERIRRGRKASRAHAEDHEAAAAAPNGPLQDRARFVWPREWPAPSRADRAAVAALKEQAAAPVALPAPEAILMRTQDLDRVFKADPTRLRQKPLRFFERGQVCSTLSNPSGDVAWPFESLPQQTIVSSICRPQPCSWPTVTCAKVRGASSSSKASRPQQTIVLSVRTPHVRQSPALICKKTYYGTRPGADRVGGQGIPERTAEASFIGQIVSIPAEARVARWLPTVDPCSELGPAVPTKC
jgi:hypothetical protein